MTVHAFAATNRTVKVEQVTGHGSCYLGSRGRGRGKWNPMPHAEITVKVVTTDTATGQQWENYFCDSCARSCIARHAKLAKDEQRRQRKVTKQALIASSESRHEG